MNGKLLLFAIVLLSPIAIVVVVEGNAVLTKKHTLKIQALLPITGEAAPMGDLCIKPIEYFVNKVNSQTKYLKDYNVVVDLADDQCSGSTGVKQILPYFFADRVSNRTSAKIGKYQIPTNQTTIHDSAKAYLTSPLLIGSICSDVCQVVGRLLHHFELIGSTGGCNSDALSDDKKYPNLYRSAASSQFLDITLDLIKHLQWDYVAIISDANKFNLIITEDQMVKLQDHNITVAGVEVFISDSREAIERLKDKGVRVIIANCFFDMCIQIACEAYKAGFYGQRIVWLFPVDIEDQTSNVNCTWEELKEIRSKSLIQFSANNNNVDPTGKQYYSSEFGFVFQDLDDYLHREIPNVESIPFFRYRIMCIDNIAPAIFLLDKMERKLNSEGSTLVDVISDTSMRHEVMEMARESLESIKMNLYRGPLDFDGDRINVAPPGGFYQYLNDNVSVVFQNNNQTTKSIIWWTIDGKRPKSRPSVKIEFQILKWRTYLISILYILFIPTILAISFWEMKHGSSGPTLYSISRLKCLLFIGMIFYAIPVIFQSYYGTKLQCSVAPIFLSIGFYFESIGLFSRMPLKKKRITIGYTFRGSKMVPDVRDVDDNSNFKPNFTLIIFGLILNILLLSLWYYGSQPIAVDMYDISYKMLEDEITKRQWYQCSSANPGSVPISGILLIVFHASVSLVLLFKAISLKGRIAPPTFVLVTSHLAALLITAVLPQVDLVFFVLAIIFLLTNVFISCCFLPDPFISSVKLKLGLTVPARTTIRNQSRKVEPKQKNGQS